MLRRHGNLFFHNDYILLCHQPGNTLGIDTVFTVDAFRMSYLVKAETPLLLGSLFKFY